MRKKGWILLLILLCIAFLISYAGGQTEEKDKAELVQMEKIQSTGFSFGMNDIKIIKEGLIIV